VQQQVFNKFRQVVYRETGISLGPSKEALVAARVGKRLRALGIDDYETYLEQVESDASGEEMTQLVDSICTNVTSFFREEEHFSLVRQLVGERFALGEDRIRIWSAACSTGEEVYSLAMTLSDIGDAQRDLDLKILGTDLSTRALSTALSARYQSQKVAALHPELLRTFFCEDVADDGIHYCVAPELCEMTVFRQLNLARPPFPLKGPLDVVLCRNVMIYFDQSVREGLLGEISRLLRPGGHLIVGHAESLSGTRSGLVPVAPSVYVKP
jgi:chemotaxis protein methyltransferase CheR